LSIKTKRPGDQNKLVVREFGRRLYASDEEYVKAMKEASEKYVIDRYQLIKQSEFKKPYREDDYVGMEYRWQPPDWPTPLPPSGPDQGVDLTKPLDTCKPVILDIDGPYFDCECESDCYVEMMISCSPNVGDVLIDGQLFDKGELRFNLSDFKHSKYPRSDTVNLFVTATGFDPGEEVNFKIETMTQPPDKTTQPIINKNTGDQIGEAHYSAGLIIGQMKFPCCGDSISIGYTSQQMSCNGTQVLTALPAEDAEGCFSWEITAGAGSLSTNSGKITVYTAPSNNGECAGNPTITLTSTSGATATLKIAINCYVYGGLAYATINGTDGGVGAVCNFLLPCGSGYINGTELVYKCDGSWYGTTYCSCYSPYWACWIGDWPCETYGCYKACAEEACVPCDQEWVEYMYNTYCPGYSSITCGSIRDTRTSAMKTGGCCPAALL